MLLGDQNELFEVLVHHRSAELSTVRRFQRVRPRRRWDRQPVLGPEGGTVAAARQSRAQIRSVSGVRCRDAHSSALLLHVGCSLAGLYLVRHIKVILPCVHAHISKVTRFQRVGTAWDGHVGYAIVTTQCHGTRTRIHTVSHRDSYCDTLQSLYWLISSLLRILRRLSTLLCYVILLNVIALRKL